MEESDPFEHLEWDTISKDDLIDHIADLMEETTWHNNCSYPRNVTIAKAIELRIMGFDAGLESAIGLCPENSNFNEWKVYYLFVMMCHGGEFQLDL